MTQWWLGVSFFVALCLLGLRVVQFALWVFEMAGGR